MSDRVCGGSSWELPEGRLCWSETGKLCFPHAKCGALDRALPPAPDVARAVSEPLSRGLPQDSSLGEGWFLFSLLPRHGPRKLMGPSYNFSLPFQKPDWVRALVGLLIGGSEILLCLSFRQADNRGCQPPAGAPIPRSERRRKPILLSQLWPGGRAKAASQPHQGCKISQVCMSSNLPTQRP